MDALRTRMERRPLPLRSLNRAPRRACCAVAVAHWRPIGLKATLIAFNRARSSGVPLTRIRAATSADPERATLTEQIRLVGRISGERGEPAARARDGSSHLGLEGHEFCETERGLPEAVRRLL